MSSRAALAAHRALQRADETVIEAQSARDEAAAELDRQLAAVGWKRLRGRFQPRRNTALCQLDVHARRRRPDQRRARAAAP